MAKKKKKSFFRKLRKKFRKASRFKKGMIIYISVAAIALIVFFIVFATFIGSYESSMPSHAVEEIVKLYEKSDIKKILDEYVSNTNKFESEDAVANAYGAVINGKKITYAEDSEYRESSPVYVIKADGLPIAKAYLEKGNSGLFGMDRWTVANLNIYDYIRSAKTITISAPEGSTVQVNGKDVDDSFKTATDEVPALLADVTQFLKTVPKNCTYTIPGFFSDPVVTATSSDGKELSVAGADNNYTVGEPASDDFIASQKDRIIKIMEAYGKKYINIGGSMSQYVIDGSPFEESLTLSTTSWYPSESIKSYEFQNESVSNFVIYSDECYSVDIYFDLYVYFTGGGNQTQNEKADMTWLFIKDGDTYKLANFAYKSSNE